MKPEPRKLFGKHDFIFFAALLVLAAAMFLLFSLMPRGAKVIVEKDGNQVFSQNLSEIDGELERVFEGENGISVKVRFYSDGAQVISSDCPDKTCVKTGKISHAGESALCLPAKISVRLLGKSADAQTY